MAEFVYALCALTSTFCAVLLVRAYRGGRTRFLLWSSLGFLAFAVNNILVFIDLVVVDNVDLSVARNAVAFVGSMTLLVGFIWDAP
jgi:hypothetical protein